MGVNGAFLRNGYDMNTKPILNDVKSALVSLMGCGRKRREAILI